MSHHLALHHLATPISLKRSATARPRPRLFRLAELLPTATPFPLARLRGRWATREWYKSELALVPQVQTLGERIPAHAVVLDLHETKPRLTQPAVRPTRRVSSHSHLVRVGSSATLVVGSMEMGRADTLGAVPHWAHTLDAHNTRSCSSVQQGMGSGATIAPLLGGSDECGSHASALVCLIDHEQPPVTTSARGPSHRKCGGAATNQNTVTPCEMEHSIGLLRVVSHRQPMGHVFAVQPVTPVRLIHQLASSLDKLFCGERARAYHDHSFARGDGFDVLQFECQWLGPSTNKHADTALALLAASKHDVAALPVKLLPTGQRMQPHNGSHRQVVRHRWLC